MRRKVLDLADELSTIRRAVEGSQQLIELASPHVALDSHTAASAPELASAVAQLVVERLRQVERVVRGTADAEQLVSAHNEGIGPAEGSVRVPAWSDDRRRAEAERELRRLASDKTRTNRGRR